MSETHRNFPNFSKLSLCSCVRQDSSRSLLREIELSQCLVMGGEGSGRIKGRSQRRSGVYSRPYTGGGPTYVMTVVEAVQETGVYDGYAMIVAPVRPHVADVLTQPL